MKWLILVLLLSLLAGAGVLVWGGGSPAAKPPSPEVPATHPVVDWDLLRDDRQWTYDNWEQLSWHLFAARSHHPDRVRLVAQFDINGDSCVDPQQQEAFAHALAEARKIEEARVADTVFTAFDEDADGAIAGEEMAALRGAFTPVLTVKRNTPASSFAFIMVCRQIADANGDRTVSAAEQAVVGRIEEFWIWPPGNPADYDGAHLRVEPWDVLRRDQLPQVP